MATPATAAPSRRKTAINAPDINPKYTIRKPHGDRFLKLDFYHLKVLGEDRNLTAVFDALLYFSNGKVKVLNGREDRKSEPWFDVTEVQLRYQTGGINQKTIRSHVSALVEKGFLTVRPGEVAGYCATHQYLVNYEAMDRAVDRHFPIGSFTDGDENPIGTFTDEPSVLLPTAIGTFTDIYKEEEVKEHIQENNTEENPLSLSQDQSQNLPSTTDSAITTETPLSAPAAPCEEKNSTTQSTWPELYAEMEVSDFVTLVYGRNRGRHIDATGKYIPGKLKSQRNAPTRAKIEDAQRKCSLIDFRMALWCYLDTEDAKLREDKWPLLYFLREPLRYLPEIPHWPRIDPATQSPRSAPARISSDAIANDSARFSATEPRPPIADLKNPLTYIDRWNTIVYGSPVDVTGVPKLTMVGLKQAIGGGDFEKCFERVYEKCQRMNANKPGTITFDGLFIGYIPMWHQIYAGTHDWKIGKDDPFASVLAAAEREEREGQ